MLSFRRAEGRLLLHHQHQGCQETTLVNRQAEVHICIPILPPHHQQVHRITTHYRERVAAPRT